MEDKKFKCCKCGKVHDYSWYRMSKKDGKNIMFCTNDSNICFEVLEDDESAIPEDPEEMAIVEMGVIGKAIVGKGGKMNDE